ncbi:hypothetical protein KGQ20_45610 [Catenulispora sp. NF23]|uniref:hypothetical protein n=1 Tax=Catenulispora pinistramenti TaxID=2705254 RepID=UPI001BA7F58F|nr:hypothetical protein [Catenulispora pinistramenti]MBS2540044.1 hypothetical protein [Catenulispora pinistramenti]
MAGGPGGSITNGLLPPTSNTGGPGGLNTQGTSPAGTGGAGHTGYVVLTLLDSPTAAPAGGSTYTGQQIVPYSGNAFGQTLNSQNSYATAACAGGTLTVQIVLNQTNHPGATFQPVYLLDSGSFVWTGVMLTTDANGSGAAAFTVTGIAPGSHTMAIDINNTPNPGDTYYVPTARIPFTC